MIAGDEYVAEVTTLRKHDVTGAGHEIEVPNLSEEYGASAAEAEWNAAGAMRRWLSQAERRFA